MAAPAAAVINTSQTSLPQPSQPSTQQQQPQTTTAQNPLSSLSPPPSNPSSNAGPSPSKASLTTWWKGFKSKPLFRKGEEQEVAPKGIFGVSLNTSIQYAYVNISITNPAGNSEVYGRIPIIVAKCGVFLKDKATDVEGIFRVSGSAKRIKELQSYFDSPPTYGKSLDWDGFNVHDAANVFRRYINHLPEPIIPHDYYFAFRKPLGIFPMDLLIQADNADIEETIRTYQKLIGDLPKLNGQLLLYILDLLAVFAENSQANLMPAANLAAIFQPGLISHPDHDMNPQEYKASQEVLIFLIEHQERFLPTSAAKREKTRPMSQQPTPPAKYSGTHPGKEIPQEIYIPRRRTMPKKTDASAFGNVLRRHRSNRVPQSPKLAVEEEEPRRVSEGSAPSNRDDNDDTTALHTAISRRNPSPQRPSQPIRRTSSFEQGRQDVLSSPVTASTQPVDATSDTEIVANPVDEVSVEKDDEILDATLPVASHSEKDVIQPVQENNVNHSVPDSNHVIEVTKSTNNGATKGTLLAVSSTAMGRSSSYREELDEIIDYGDQITSADNTEAETSDGASNAGKKKSRRRSRLPWSSNSDAKLPWSSGSDASGEPKVSSIFSFTSAPSGDDKPTKKLQKKKRTKDSDVTAGILIAETSASTPASEMSQSERGLGALSPQPWTQQNNISQSSLNASELSRRSHISSNRSSVDLPRSRTPIGTRPMSLTPTTFEEIQHRRLLVETPQEDDELPARVIMPAAREDKPRASSQSSNHSAASSGKGSKIGNWLRKKRGYSVSSSTSAAVDD